MTSSITIGMPDEIRDELQARAALCGRSVEDYVRDELIALASRPSAAVWMARVKARKDALQTQSAPATLVAGCSADPAGRAAGAMASPRAIAAATDPDAPPAS